MADISNVGIAPALRPQPSHKESLPFSDERFRSMSSASPPNASGAGGTSPAEGDSPDLLKSLNDKRLTRDGQPAKRRGPKPDSKPALTRRQELNRQAQRTHRERKEFYIKALEEEVLRLRETYSNVAQDKEKLVEENKQLKALLSGNGSLPTSAGLADDAMSNLSAGGYASSGSVSGSYAADSAAVHTPPLTQSTATSVAGSSHMAGIQLHGQPQPQRQHYQQQAALNVPQVQPPQHRVDFEQAGIDFVLTYDNPDDPTKALEKPCMEHLPWLVEMSTEPGSKQPCGHALMASCPPDSFTQLNNQIPFGNQYSTVEAPRPAQTWELSKGDLTTLLHLSAKLDLDGEITPVMAWGTIINHPRLSELRAEDLKKVTEELKGKVRCYGFGAVLEEFEVRDALNSVFTTHPEIAMTY